MNEKEIRRSLDTADQETLRDMLSILLSEDSHQLQTVQTVPEAHQADYANFAQALLALKKKYSFPELALFSTEADLVYVQAGDRRVLLSERTSSSKNQSNTAASPLGPEAEGSPPAASGTDFDTAFEPETKENGRFGRLEM